MATGLVVLLLRILLAALGVTLIAVAWTDAKSTPLLQGAAGMALIALAFAFQIQRPRR